MLVPETFRVTEGRALGAGPDFTDPSLTEKCELWHGQMISPPETVPTVQPWCVHTALKPLKVPAAGWVMTTF